MNILSKWLAGPKFFSEDQIFPPAIVLAGINFLAKAYPHFSGEEVIPKQISGEGVSPERTGEGVSPERLARAYPRSELEITFLEWQRGDLIFFGEEQFSFF